MELKTRLGELDEVQVKSAKELIREEIQGLVSLEEFRKLSLIKRCNLVAVSVKKVALRNQRGAIDLTSIFSAGVLSFAAVMFIIELAPELENGIAGYAGTNTFIIAFLGIAEWAVPVGMLVAVVVGVFKHMEGSRS